MPLHRRVPKRGFTNIWHKEYSEVNLDRLEVFDAGHDRDPRAARRARHRPEAARRHQGPGRRRPHQGAGRCGPTSSAPRPRGEAGGPRRQGRRSSEPRAGTMLRACATSGTSGPPQRVLFQPSVCSRSIAWATTCRPPASTPRRSSTSSSRTRATGSAGGHVLGGNLAKVTVFALGIMPVHLGLDHPAAADVVWPYWRSSRRKASSAGARSPVHPYGTVALSIVQSLRIACTWSV